MTLQEALQGHDWIPDPSTDNRARIAGPDNKVAVIVEEGEDGKLRCWLWSPQTGRRVEGIHLTVNKPVELDDAIDELYSLRQTLGDCPKCGSPMGIVNSQVVCPLCGRRNE